VISRPDNCDGRTAQTRCHQLNEPAITLSSTTPGHIHPLPTDCTLVDKLTRTCFWSRGCAPLQPPRARDRIRPSTSPSLTGLPCLATRLRTHAKRLPRISSPVLASFPHLRGNTKHDTYRRRPSPSPQSVALPFES
jgi:hypothetical protein